MPTLVQCTSSNCTDGNTVTQLRIQLPNASLSGNCIAVFVASDAAGVAPTVADDKSNTYTQVLTLAAGQRGTWLIATNITAGVRLVDVNFSSAVGFVNATVTEYYNVSTASGTTGVDGSNSNSGSGTSLTSGSFTPGTTDTLVLAGFIQTTNNLTATDFTPGAGFTGLSNDRWNSVTYTEYKIHPTATAINPASTMAPTNAWTACGFALKNATAGTAPGGGIRTIRYQHNGMNATGGSSVVINQPSSGNLLILLWNDPSSTITAITDSASNTWTIGTAFHSGVGGNDGFNQICYVQNAITSNTLVITITLNVAFGGFCCQTLDVAGAATSSFVQTVGGTGSNTSTTSTTTSAAAITPNAANNLIVTIWGRDASVTLSVSGGGQFMTNLPTPNIGTPSPIDQDNGFAVQISPSTSTITHTWTTSIAPGAWAEVNAEFKPAPAGPVDPGYMLNYHR